jgi:SAM-dependent methyltransferase
MCNDSCLSFTRNELSAQEVAGGFVLEVGSLDVNGSVRPVIEALGPASYLGVDLERGPGVDEICDVGRLVERFGEHQFDVVVSTELVEHVRDWRSAFSNMKRALKPGGTILITTRSRGFPLHGYPSDYWRYEPEDMQSIFADFEVITIEQDPESPGVFVKARKPSSPTNDAQLDDIELYSVAARKRTRYISKPVALVHRIRFLPSQTSFAQGLRNRLAFRTRYRELKARRPR